MLGTAHSLLLKLRLLLSLRVLRFFSPAFAVLVVIIGGPHCSSIRWQTSGSLLNMLLIHLHTLLCASSDCAFPSEEIINLPWISSFIKPYRDYLITLIWCVYEITADGARQIGLQFICCIGYHVILARCAPK